MKFPQRSFAIAFAVVVTELAFSAPVLNVPPTPVTLTGQLAVQTSEGGGKTDVDPTICFDATATTMYFQYQLNETGNDSQITLLLDLWEDIDGGNAGENDGATEDAGFTGDIEPATTLGSDTGGPSAYEYSMTGFTVGERYCIGIDVQESSNGPDYAQVTSVSAVPEPSAFLFLGLLFAGVAGRGWWRRNSAT